MRIFSVQSLVFRSKHLPLSLSTSHSNLNVMLLTTTPSIEGHPIREYRGIISAELTKEAQRLGANAVVGLKLDYEAVGASGSMLMVVASGTAVVI